MNLSQEGIVRISEDVIEQIAIQALARVIGIQPANPSPDFEGMDNGRKPNGGVRILVEFEEGNVPSIVVDAFIKTKYGLRIPDISWYVQESIKSTLEQYTGYNVKGVNVFAQGVYLENEKA
ncbi:MAG: Asp23/Gls24 family envelope stress response protein [Thermovirgaceae bacterium]|nr:Asp23/Gls24 family envelope stress response protein [Thermovirgaceae bacterium]